MANDFSTQLRAALNKQTTSTHEQPADLRGELEELVEKVTGAEFLRDTRWLDVDSLDRIELAVRAEERFGVRFDEPPTIQTLGELADYIVTCAEKQ